MSTCTIPIGWAHEISASVQETMYHGWAHKIPASVQETIYHEWAHKISASGGDHLSWMGP